MARLHVRRLFQAFLCTGSFASASTLSQNQTNGASQLGSLTYPPLPHFLTTNPLPDGTPWGNATPQTSAPNHNVVDTGVTRYYDFTVARDRLSPDGTSVDVMLVNGEFPGPTIEANWGDSIQVTVHNAITGPEEGTTMHWHGLSIVGTPWADGVPAVGQCPITPGTSLIYRFQAASYGTSWYHSHYSAQYSSGVHGAMIIYGPSQVDYDIDLGPVILSDWYHQAYQTIVQQVESPARFPGYRPMSDSNLINGRGGDAPHADFRFVSGKKHRLRLINTSSEALVVFSIDNHVLSVIANDYIPIRPYDTNFVTLGVGQRSDVIVTAKGHAADSVWMRSHILEGCAGTRNPEAKAAIYYEYADISADPFTTGKIVPEARQCKNDGLDKTVPMYHLTPETNPGATLDLHMTLQTNGSGVNLWYMNNVSFVADYDCPVLLQAAQGNTTFQRDWNVYNQGSYSSIRLIVYNYGLGAHPMHLHGHDFSVLAEGVGQWDGSIVNAANPQRRDTQQIAGAIDPKVPTYLVLQWNQDNPGVWPFHCHIAWHVSGGMYMQFLERPADVATLAIPQQYYETCSTWSTWQQAGLANQSQSRIKRKDSHRERSATGRFVPTLQEG